MSALSTAAKEVLQRTLMRKAFLWRLRHGKECALTFDDGPNPTYTPQIVDLLGRHRIKASFFVVGQSASKQPDLVRLLVQEGHTVASHTYSHRDLPGLAVTELKHELDECRRLIRQLTDIDTRLVRPPRGRVDGKTLMRLRRWGYLLVHWSRTYSDYRQDGTAALLQRIRGATLRPRDIVLLHDNNPFTVEALREILPEWGAAGHRFVTLK